MIHADRELAVRLESLISAEFRRLADVGRVALPETHAECLEMGDGVALWLGEGSPVNQAVGFGMEGQVDDADVERIEAFYHERRADAAMSVCPLADPSLLPLLGRRGWIATAFEHVLALDLEHTLSPDPGGLLFSLAGLEVEECAPAERPIWARLATAGFSEGVPPTPGEDEFGRVMAAREEVRLLLARISGTPVGTGALIIDEGVGWLSGDSTLSEYRRRGVQQALQRHRLRLAREAGCALAVTEAEPASGSQRNMERLGFRIVYTHVEFAKPV